MSNCECCPGYEYCNMYCEECNELFKYCECGEDGMFCDNCEELERNCQCIGIKSYCDDCQEKKEECICCPFGDCEMGNCVCHLQSYCGECQERLNECQCFDEQGSYCENCEKLESNCECVYVNNTNNCKNHNGHSFHTKLYNGDLIEICYYCGYMR